MLDNLIGSLWVLGIGVLGAMGLLILALLIVEIFTRDKGPNFMDF